MFLFYLHCGDGQEPPSTLIMFNIFPTRRRMVKLQLTMLNSYEDCRTHLQGTEDLAGVRVHLYCRKRSSAFVCPFLSREHRFVFSRAFLIMLFAVLNGKSLTTVLRRARTLTAPNTVSFRIVFVACAFGAVFEYFATTAGFPPIVPLNTPDLNLL